MPQIITRELIDEFRRVRLTRDPRQIEPFLSDDVDWLVSGPVELMHFCGHRRGKAEVIDCIIREQPAVLNVLKIEIAATLIDRYRTATFGRLTAILPDTGRTISYHQAQFMRFRNGKIVEYRGLIDSFDAAEQMIGHPIEFAAGSRGVDDGNLVTV